MRLMETLVGTALFYSPHFVRAIRLCLRVPRHHLSQRVRTKALGMLPLPLPLCSIEGFSNASGSSNNGGIIAAAVIVGLLLLAGAGVYVYYYERRMRQRRQSVDLAGEAAGGKVGELAEKERGNAPAEVVRVPRITPVPL
jgi:hypothetical protein